ncbi:hypothetical protein [Actinoallomurus rhizosphaericola]|nr:hypothetical protein [Actinoallomurus rhizosphaericola]MCO5996256.1 hypothetical protein [Actinoallomurus rhizosphaericola]
MTGRTVLAGDLPCERRELRPIDGLAAVRLWPPPEQVAGGGSTYVRAC